MPCSYPAGSSRGVPAEEEREARGRRGILIDGGGYVRNGQTVR